MPFHTHRTYIAPYHLTSYYTIDGSPTTDLEPAPEYAARVVKQLVKLCRLLAILRGHSSITDEELATAIRVARDTVLPRRITVLRTLFMYGALPQSEIIKKSGASGQPIRTALQELQLIGMVQYDEETSNYTLDDTARRVMQKAFGPFAL